MEAIDNMEEIIIQISQADALLEHNDTVKQIEGVFRKIGFIRPGSIRYIK